MNKKLKTIISRGLVVAMLIGGTGTMLVGCNNDNEGTKIEMMNREDADFEAQGMIGAVYGYGLDKTVFESLKNQVIVMVKFSEEDIANVTEEQLDIFTLQNRIEQMYLDNGHDLKVTVYIYDEDGKVKLFESADPNAATEDTNKEEIKEESTEPTKKETNKPAKKDTTTDEEDQPGFIKDGTHLEEQMEYNEMLEDAYDDGYNDGYNDSHTEPSPEPEPNPESSYEETTEPTQDYE